MNMERKVRIANAFRAMKAIGIREDKVKPVLKELLILNHKNWEPIEEENYRALADAINKKEAQDHSEEGAKEAEESEPPLKRLKQEYPDGQTSPLTVSKAHASNMPCIKLNTALLREKLKNLIEARRLADETNLGSTPASNLTTSEKKKASDSPNLNRLRKAFRDDEPSDLAKLLDSFLMSLRKELSGFDMPANAAAGSESHIAQALRHFASGAFSLVCAGEGMKSNHTTVLKLQAEATALRFEVAEVNKAKDTVVENLKTAQSNFQTLFEELEDVKADREAIKATLGKTREWLKSSGAALLKLQAEATALKFEVAKANKAKATVVENHKTAQSNFQKLFEELEDVKADREAIKATLGKTREGLKSSRATALKLQAEATALRFEVAEANKAKATVAENLKTTQSNFQTLLVELEDVKAVRKAILATLGKTRALRANLQEELESEGAKLRSKLQAREQELVASKKELEVAKKELDAAKQGQTLEFNKLIESEVFGPQRETIEQVALETLVDTIMESHPEWDLSFLFSETKEEVDREDRPWAVYKRGRSVVVDY